LLSGKINRQTAFSPEDHRNFNRNGAQFDRGETFSGVDFDVALDAVDQIRKLLPEGVTMPNFALRWILDYDAVGCVIPGARNEEQIKQNVAASALPSLTSSQKEALAGLYDSRIRSLVHQRW
jgi:aryl-alcohol dehydrogenase-like predicted oxidoreductase